MGIKENMKFNSRPLYNENEKPSLPEEGQEQIKVEILKSTGSRYHYYYNNNYFDPEETYGWYNKGDDSLLPESQSIKLEDVLSLVKKYNLDIKDIYFTGSISDDYFNLEIVRARKLSSEEQIKEYDLALAEWNKLQEEKKEAELKRIERKMERLKEKKNFLNKK